MAAVDTVLVEHNLSMTARTVQQIVEEIALFEGWRIVQEPSAPADGPMFMVLKRLEDNARFTAHFSSWGFGQTYKLVDLKRIPDSE
jgi:hypothetical protein